MADIYDLEKRSEIMSKVRAKNTKPEIVVRTFLHSMGFRYKLHDKKLPGKPDIILPRYKTVIFVHGCFWHGHTSSVCNLMRMPKSNLEYWTKKIQYNKLRDKLNTKSLRTIGWHVITIWECNLKSKKRSSTLIKLERELRKRLINP